jgi:hypothetical protein
VVHQTTHADTSALNPPTHNPPDNTGGHGNDGRLYDDTHATFEGYCRERWGMSRIHAHRLIEATEVAAMLPIGNIENEALAPLKDDPEATHDALVEPSGDGDLTAAKIEEETGKENARPAERVVAGISALLSALLLSIAAKPQSVLLEGLCVPFPNGFMVKVRAVAWLLLLYMSGNWQRKPECRAAIADR